MTSGGRRMNTNGFMDLLEKIYSEYGEGPFVWHDIKHFMRKGPVYYTYSGIFDIVNQYNQQGERNYTYRLNSHYVQMLKRKGIQIKGKGKM